MSHQECLRDLLAKGVSHPLVRMTGAFLLRRKLRFKAGNAVSSDRSLKRGATQGTLLGNYPFLILTTDDLERPDENVTSTPKDNFIFIFIYFSF